MFCLLPFLNIISGTGHAAPGNPGESVFSTADYPAANEYHQYRFRKITEKDGLSYFRVRVITQDRYGFMWLGAENGLDRYDGNSVTSFRHNTLDTNSLPGPQVSYLLGSPEDDRLWVGTRSGLCFINVKSFRITRVDLGPNNDIRTMAEDHQGGLWIGTHTGLIHLDKSTFAYTVFNTSNSNISHNQIRSIYQDESGNLWVGTLDKLNVLKKNSTEFEIFDLRGGYEYPIQNNLILSICPRSVETDSLLWIGTETGLCLFNRYTAAYETYRKSSTRSISNDKILAIHRADSSSLWLGTEFGLNLFGITMGKRRCTIIIHGIRAPYQIIRYGPFSRIVPVLYGLPLTTV